MTTKIKWRLANRPSPHELLDLVTGGLLTKEQAQEILFSLETDEDRDKISLQEEIKFLRNLVQSMATKRTIVENIYKVNDPHIATRSWYNPYQTWCMSVDTAQADSGLAYAYTTTGNTSGAIYTSTAGGMISTDSAPDFTSVKTF